MIDINLLINTLSREDQTTARKLGRTRRPQDASRWIPQNIVKFGTLCCCRVNSHFKCQMNMLPNTNISTASISTRKEGINKIKGMSSLLHSGRAHPVNHSPIKTLAYVNCRSWMLIHRNVPLWRFMSCHNTSCQANVLVFFSLPCFCEAVYLFTVPPAPPKIIRWLSSS